jgi:hypothetical protein
MEEVLCAFDVAFGIDYAGVKSLVFAGKYCRF